MRQSEFVIRECEKCHKELMDNERRTKIKRYNILVCIKCYYLYVDK